MRCFVNLLVVACLLEISVVCQGAPPRVAAVKPDDGDEQVDPATEVLLVEFDQDMDGGLSVCGIQNQQIAGKPRWKTKRILELPIKLEPDTEYAWSLNCPSAQNFRNAKGESAPIYPLTFKTSGGKPVAAPTLEQKQAAIDQLRTAVDQKYAYRDLRRTDWEQIFERHRPELEKAGSWSKFAREAARLLSAARDMHITLRTPDGNALPTFQRQIQANFDLAQVEQQVPRFKRQNGSVATGKFESGVGYLLISGWNDANDLAFVWKALEEFAKAPGLIIDVRPNAGGNELLAAEVAGCFVREPAVYSKHDYRDASQPSGFSQQHDRQIKPNSKRPALSMPVAVLMGPASMSSNESFLLMMQTSPNVVLIGDRSYGSSGNPQPHEIGGGIVVMLPSWRDYLPDGTLLEGRGVVPDVSVPPGASDAGDPVLEVALTRLEKP